MSIFDLLVAVYNSTSKYTSSFWGVSLTKHVFSCVVWFSLQEITSHHFTFTSSPTYAFTRHQLRNVLQVHVFFPLVTFGCTCPHMFVRSASYFSRVHMGVILLTSVVLYCVFCFDICLTLFQFLLIPWFCLFDFCFSFPGLHGHFVVVSRNIPYFSSFLVSTIAELSMRGS